LKKHVLESSFGNVFVKLEVKFDVPHQM